MDIDLSVAARGVKRQSARASNRIGIWIIKIDAPDGDRDVERHRARLRNDAAKHSPAPIALGTPPVQLSAVDQFPSASML